MVMAEIRQQAAECSCNQYNAAVLQAALFTSENLHKKLIEYADTERGLHTA